MLAHSRWCLAVLVAPVAFVPYATADTVEVLRDPWGVPHIFAETDAGAFYGLGYATAEDRAFQMTYSLRIIQGRLAEVVGDVKMVSRNDSSVDHDRKMRTFGFYRAAQRTAERLDPDTKALLDAYCRGVNDWFARNKDDLPELFQSTGMTVETWTPADCLASWWHIGQFFATDGTRDLIASRNAGRSFPQPLDLLPMPPDDSPAVVQKTDLSGAWLDRVNRFAAENGLAPGSSGSKGPKFSHAWVVGGKKTTTGSAVLVSDPQTPVRNPSLFYEYHLCGKTFNARGMGVAGSPIILIGFTDRVAWGMTALGADQADLFALVTDEEHPNQYQFDGEWHDMQLVEEVIQVQGGERIPITVRETRFGPVATEFCFARPRDGQVALKRIPICEDDRDTMQGAIAMIRAGNAQEFDSALEGWRFPSANVVFGDRSGNIGYRTLGAFPLRSRADDSHGRKARLARTNADDWRGMIPHDVKPSVMNPESGFLYSGNHRPIGSWYPIPYGAMTGSGGDTVRSWRLRERLQAKQQFAPEDVRDIHFDMVNPARRDIVRLAIHLQETRPHYLSDDALFALAELAPWYHRGASMSLDEHGSAVAMQLNTFFRVVSTELAFQYGGGESGLAYFLKTATAKLDDNPDWEPTERECQFLDSALASAWQACLDRYGDNVSTWQQQARQNVKRQKLGYYESLDRFPSLASQHAINLPNLEDIDGGTISCRTAQSYTQWVPMHDPDLAQSILPIGQSERPGSKYRTSTLEMWSEGQLHPAPLSRDRVEALGVTRMELEF